MAVACRDEGLAAVSAMASPLLGPAGNVEFFLLAREGGPDTVDVDAAVREGLERKAAS